jgi:hypothetical protein
MDLGRLSSHAESSGGEPRPWYRSCLIPLSSCPAGRAHPIVLVVRIPQVRLPTRKGGRHLALRPQAKGG